MSTATQRSTYFECDAARHVWRPSRLHLRQPHPPHGSREGAHGVCPPHSDTSGPVLPRGEIVRDLSLKGGHELWPQRERRIRRKWTLNFEVKVYCGGGGGAGGVAVRRGLMGPQFNPILQSQRLAWGWSASPQHTSSGDVGVGSTVVTGSATLVGGA